MVLVLVLVYGGYHYLLLLLLLPLLLLPVPLRWPALAPPLLLVLLLRGCHARSMRFRYESYATLLPGRPSILQMGRRCGRAASSFSSSLPP